MAVASGTVGGFAPDPHDGDGRASTFVAESRDGDPAGTTDLQVSLPRLQLRRLMAAAATIGRLATVEELAAALVDSGVSAVHGTKGVVALVDEMDTHLQVVASSGYAAGYLVAWQRFPVTADVPLAEAFRTGRHVVVGSIGEFAQRYPDVELPDHRPHALVAVPLHDGTRIVGAWGIRLDTSPDPVGQVAVAAMGSQYLGNVASAGIARASTVELLEERVGQLQHALTSRVSIEQAKGVLSERHGLTTDQAFDLLRRYARNNGRRIQDVVAAILEGHLDPVSRDGHGDESTGTRRA